MRLSKKHEKYINFETGEVLIPHTFVDEFYCNNPAHPNDMFEAFEGVKPACNCTNRSGSMALCERESVWQKNLDELLDGTWLASQNRGRKQVEVEVLDSIKKGKPVDMGFASRMMEAVPDWVYDSYVSCAKDTLAKIQGGPKAVAMRRYPWQRALKGENHYFDNDSNYCMVFKIRDHSGAWPDGTLYSQKPFVFITPYIRSSKWHEALFKSPAR